MSLTCSPNGLSLSLDSNFMHQIHIQTQSHEDFRTVCHSGILLCYLHIHEQQGCLIIFLGERAFITLWEYTQVIYLDDIRMKSDRDLRWIAQGGFTVLNLGY